MKKLLGVLMLGWLSLFTLQAQTKTSRELEGFKGQVKSVRVERTEIVQRDGRSIESRRILQSLATYDEQGNKIEESLMKR